MQQSGGLLPPPAVTAEKIRITVIQTWGDPSARIMEVRASLEA